jgi:sterol 3beta-glucosyltransferase
MNITILAVGTRGDVQPYLALGVRLQSAGYSVKIATTIDFEEVAAQYDLAFAPISVNMQQMMQSPKGQSFISTNRNPLEFVRQMKGMMQKEAFTLFNEFADACLDADCIIYSNMGVAGYSIAEKLDIPALAAFIQPFTPTAEVPNLMLPPWLRLGGAFNRITYYTSNQVYWAMFGPLMNRWRKETLDLPPLSWIGPFGELHENQLPTIYGFSPTIIPRPTDWDTWVHVTGFWFLDPPPDWQPPQDLLDFLDDGPPPVYIGFGSMPWRSPRELGRLALKALKRSGQRGILLKGWGGLEVSDLPKDVFMVENIPHTWLFPRMAAVVHHAGMGTTAAGLRAGVPSIAIPFFADQPFWADRIHALGVGPAPIPIWRLSVDDLTTALRDVTNNEIMQRRAQDLGRRLQAEDGVAKAEEVVTSYLR